MLRTLLRIKRFHNEWVDTIIFGQKHLESEFID